MPAEQIPPSEDTRQQQNVPDEDGPALDLNAILETSDRPVVSVGVAEWGGTVHLRTVMGVDLDRLDQYMLSHRTEGGDFNGNWRASLVLLSLSDPAGEPLYRFESFEQFDEAVRRLGSKSGPVLDRLFQVAQRLNQRTKADRDELKKASEAGQRASSPSGSAVTSEDGAHQTSASAT